METKGEMLDVLDQEIRALEAESVATLWDRFTELSGGLLSRRLRRTEKGEEVWVRQTESGASYEVEIGLAIEHGRDLHFFVSVFDKDGESVGGDTIVAGPR